MKNNKKKALISLQLKIKQYKRFHSRFVVLDGIVVGDGSHNRVVNGESCYVNVRQRRKKNNTKKNDNDNDDIVLDLCNYLSKLTTTNDDTTKKKKGGGTTKWVQISNDESTKSSSNNTDEKKVIVIIDFNIDSEIPIERNRRGYKILECYNIKEILNTNNNKKNDDNDEGKDSNRNDDDEKRNNSNLLHNNHYNDDDTKENFTDDYYDKKQRKITNNDDNDWISSGSIFSSSSTTADYKENEDDNDDDDNEAINTTSINNNTIPTFIYDKIERHRLFAKWLVDIYGKYMLCQGSGILDVAGGNGELSLELNKMGIPSTILDPNPRLNTNTTNKNNSSSSSLLGIIPKAIYDDGSHLTDIGSNNNKKNTSQLSSSSSSSQNSMNYITSSEDIRTIILNCSIIVGMHPDQATEPIVDMALRLSKNFATLPCCVMPSLFPHRYQKNHKNQPVRSYKTFCQYLLDKVSTATTTPTKTDEDENNNNNNSNDVADDNQQQSIKRIVDDNPIKFEVAYLPFNGRNRIIYCRSFLR